MNSLSKSAGKVPVKIIDKAITSFTPSGFETDLEVDGGLYEGTGDCCCDSGAGDSTAELAYGSSFHNECARFGRKKMSTSPMVSEMSATMSGARDSIHEVR